VIEEHRVPIKGYYTVDRSLQTVKDPLVEKLLLISRR